jgi:hypothetical protein
MGEATGSARVHAKWIGGYQVFYTAHANRWLKAVGPDVTHFEMTRGMPLNGPAADDTYWGTCTVTDASVGAAFTIVSPIAVGVPTRMTTDVKEYDGGNLQASGATFAFAANKPLYAGAKIAINHATSTDLFWGLCTTRTEILKASGSHIIHASTQSHAGFYKLDGGTATLYAAEKSGSISSSSAATMDTSAHIYEIYWDGSTTLTYYVDGSAVSTITTTANIPTTALRPSLCFRAGNSAARVCDVYWWRTIQVGQ